MNTDEQWGVEVEGVVVYGPFPDSKTAEFWAKRAENASIILKWNLIRIVWPMRVS